MTWKEVLENNCETVIVQSYGYMEVSSFSKHFEPFSKLREFTFKVTPFGLEHSWLFLEEDENELTFEEKDGKIYLFDPNLLARP